jgi:hypothetical protein
VRNLASHIAGLPARSAKARYQAASSCSLRTLALQSSSDAPSYEMLESMFRCIIAIASVDFYRSFPHGYDRLLRYFAD